MNTFLYFIDRRKDVVSDEDDDMDDEGSTLPARGDRRDKHYSSNDVEMDEA